MRLALPEEEAGRSQHIRGKHKRVERSVVVVGQVLARSRNDKEKEGRRGLRRDHSQRIDGAVERWVLGSGFWVMDDDGGGCGSTE